VLLIYLGLVVVAAWGIGLPRLPWVKTHPKWLASDPDALARFHRSNSRYGVIAGFTLLVIGLITLL
jgi:hypothetical protein